MNRVELVELEQVQDGKIPFCFGKPFLDDQLFIRIDNGQFGYLNQNLILDHIDFSLNMQSRVALLGKNGCGKTTLINIILE